MGNAQGREARGQAHPQHPNGPGAFNRHVDPTTVTQGATPQSHSQRHPGSNDRSYSGRNGGGRSMGRGDSLFSAMTGSGREPDPSDPTARRETRAEREARKLEKERAQRAKDRERSIREEHVDGGFLVTMGVYTGTEDFSKPIVRQLQVSLSKRKSYCKHADNKFQRSSADWRPSGEASMTSTKCGRNTKSLPLLAVCRSLPPTNRLQKSC